MVVLPSPVPRTLAIRHVPASWERFGKLCEMAPEKSQITTPLKVQDFLASLEGYCFHSKAYQTTTVFLRTLLHSSVHKMWGFVILFFRACDWSGTRTLIHDAWWWILTLQRFSSLHHPAFRCHHSHRTSVSWRPGSPDLTACAGVLALTCWCLNLGYLGFSHCGTPAPSWPGSSPAQPLGGVRPPPQAELWRQPKARRADAWLLLMSFLLSDLCSSEDHVKAPGVTHPSRPLSTDTDPLHAGICLTRKTPLACDIWDLQDDWIAGSWSSLAILWRKTIFIVM